MTILIVVALALAMERIAFRPVRNASAATLLITSFALSFLIQNLAALTWGSLPRTTDFASGLSSSFTVGSLEIQKLDVVTVVVTVSLLAAVGLFFRRTTLGVQMRAAAEDFRMARVLGIRAEHRDRRRVRAVGAARRRRPRSCSPRRREPSRRRSASTSSWSRSWRRSSAAWGACAAPSSAGS